MCSIIKKNDLDILYFEKFYQPEEADDIFLELYKLPFSKCNLNIGGRIYTPLRKMYAFGDPGLCYKFSGTSVAAQKWTPLMCKVKEDVESKLNTSFNYCLLNLYENGFAKIGAHKDDEKELNPTSPIACLSFGALRNVIFQRTGFKSVKLPIRHGSLYSMNHPTNRYWKHGIPAQLQVKEPRISLTFRNISSTQGTKRKQSKLDDDETTQIPDNDWLTQYIQRQDPLLQQTLN